MGSQLDLPATVSDGLGGVDRDVAPGGLEAGVRRSRVRRSEPCVGLDALAV